MQVHEFFHKYANVPLKVRTKKLKTLDKSKTFTLSDIYQEVSRLEDKMRPMRIEQDKLIKFYEDYIKTL